MAERNTTRLLSKRLTFVALWVLLVFLHLLPIDSAQPSPLSSPSFLARIWAGPDLHVAITLAWVLRRPEYVPAVLVAATFLMSDLLLQRPPGLWAAFALIGSEALRRRAPGLRDLTFSMEWLNVAMTMIAMFLGYRIVLGVMMVEAGPLGPALMQAVATIAIYPIVVAASQFLFGVRKLAPGDIDGMEART
ncbi:rod shape-determining protein MreD [Roseovarius sp. MMSF_3281]|uniref:rod shape-determining protein MreD n=1 Tax=Roseovarius sp. MMSF_3281 TaxID=3046694 RepID=UPI00273E2EA0|nr:rod shape-determining protein MreD [Roseovarius sp. MMSF_3281]